jgi:hypothetical protein
MSAEALQGLTCPRCGGVVPIPEGFQIVACPYCDLRSIVQGENGVRRYQIEQRVDRAEAQAAFERFLHSSPAIAATAAKEAQVNEVFLVHLPFWTAWGRALGWVFGQKEVGSGDNRHYEPREMRVAEDMSWNNAACDVGEFGVQALDLTGRPLLAFKPDDLHRSGMVFEPTGSAKNSLDTAREDFKARVEKQANLDRVSQSFVRIIRPRLALVYAPLWVVRYLYRGRVFQVVIDAYSGEVVYGKAPGNLAFRAGVLVGGMAGGSVLAVTIPGLVVFNMNGDGAWVLALLSLLGGLFVMNRAWKKYRYGEHYEYRRIAPKAGLSFFDIKSTAGELVEIARHLEID